MIINLVLTILLIYNRFFLNNCITRHVKEHVSCNARAQTSRRAGGVCTDVISGGSITCTVSGNFWEMGRGAAPLVKIADHATFI